MFFVGSRAGRTTRRVLGHPLWDAPYEIHKNQPGVSPGNLWIFRIPGIPVLYSYC